jgi:hypothetical protein
MKIKELYDIYPILYLQRCVKKYKGDWVVFENFYSIKDKYFRYYSINGVVYHFYTYTQNNNKLVQIPFGNKKVEIELTDWELFIYKIKFWWFNYNCNSWATHSFNAIRVDNEIIQAIKDGRLK